MRLDFIMNLMNLKNNFFKKFKISNRLSFSYDVNNITNRLMFVYTVLFLDQKKVKIIQNLSGLDKFAYRIFRQLKFIDSGPNRFVFFRNILSQKKYQLCVRMVGSILYI